MFPTSPVLNELLILKISNVIGSLDAAKLPLVVFGVVGVVVVGVVVVVVFGVAVVFVVLFLLVLLKNQPRSCWRISTFYL